MKLKEYVAKLLAELRYNKNPRTIKEIDMLCQPILHSYKDNNEIRKVLVNLWKKENIHETKIDEKTQKEVEIDPDKIDTIELYQILSRNGKEINTTLLSAVYTEIQKGNIKNEDLTAQEEYVNSKLTLKSNLSYKGEGIVNLNALVKSKTLEHSNVVDEIKANTLLDTVFDLYAYDDNKITKIKEDYQKINADSKLEKAKNDALKEEVYDYDKVSFKKESAVKFYNEYLEISKIMGTGKDRLKSIYDNEEKKKAEADKLISSVSTNEYDKLNGLFDERNNTLNTKTELQKLVEKYENSTKNDEYKMPLEFNKFINNKYLENPNGLAKVEGMYAAYEIVNKLKITTEQFIKDPIKALNDYKKQFVSTIDPEDDIDKSIDKLIPNSTEAELANNKIYKDAINYLITLEPENKLNLKLLANIEAKEKKMLLNSNVNKAINNVDFYKDLLVSGAGTKVKDLALNYSKDRINKFKDEVEKKRLDNNYAINPKDVIDIDRVIEIYDKTKDAIKKKYGAEDTNKVKIENLKAAQKELSDLVVATINICKDIKVISAGNKELEDKFNKNDVAKKFSTDFGLIRDDLPLRDLVSSLHDIEAIEDANKIDANYAHISEAKEKDELFHAYNIDSISSAITNQIQNINDEMATGNLTADQLVYLSNTVKHITNQLIEYQNQEYERLQQEYEKGNIPESYFKARTQQIYNNEPIGALKLFNNEEEKITYGKKTYYVERGYEEKQALNNGKEIIDNITKNKSEINIDPSKYDLNIQNKNTATFKESDALELQKEIHDIRNMMYKKETTPYGKKELEYKLRFKTNELLYGYLRGADEDKFEKLVSNFTNLDLKSQLMNAYDNARYNYLANLVYLERNKQGLPAKEFKKGTAKEIIDAAKEVGLNPEKILKEFKMPDTTLFANETLSLFEEELRYNKPFKDRDIKVMAQENSINLDGMLVYESTRELKNIVDLASKRAVLLYNASKTADDTNAMEYFFKNISNINENTTRLSSNLAKLSNHKLSADFNALLMDRDELVRKAAFAENDYKDSLKPGFYANYEAKRNFKLENDVAVNLLKLSDVDDFDLDEYKKAKLDLINKIKHLNFLSGKLKKNEGNDKEFLDTVKEVNELNKRISKMEKDANEFAEIAKNLSPNSAFLPSYEPDGNATLFVPKALVGNTKIFGLMKGMKDLKRIAKENGVDVKDLLKPDNHKAYNELIDKLNNKIKYDALPNKDDSLKDTINKLSNNDETKYTESKEYQDKQALMYFFAAADEKNRDAILTANAVENTKLNAEVAKVIENSNIKEVISERTYYNLIVAPKDYDKSKLIDNREKDKEEKLIHKFYNAYELLLDNDERINPETMEANYKELKEAMEANLEGEDLEGELAALTAEYIRGLHDFFDNCNDKNVIAKYDKYKKQLEKPEKVFNSINPKFAEGYDPIIEELKGDLIAYKVDEKDIKKDASKNLDELTKYKDKLIKTQEANSKLVKDSLNKNENIEQSLKKFYDDTKSLAVEFANIAEKGIVPKELYENMNNYFKNVTPLKANPEFDFKLNERVFINHGKLMQRNDNEINYKLENISMPNELTKDDLVKEKNLDRKNIVIDINKPIENDGNNIINENIINEPVNEINNIVNDNPNKNKISINLGEENNNQKSKSINTNNKEKNINLNK